MLDAADAMPTAPVSPIDLREGRIARDAARGARGAETAPGPAQDEGGASIKEVSKGAIGWLHDALPWTAPKDSGNTARAAPVGPVSSDSLVLPVETAGAASQVFSPHVAPLPKSATATAAVDPRGAAHAAPVSDTGTLSRAMDAGPEDAFHRLLRKGHGVMVHPLTWLVIVLLGAGHVLVSRFNRRR